MGDSRNSKTLTSFVDYCRAHPDFRFWQALCTWAGVGYVVASDTPSNGEGQEDTWRWEGRFRDEL